MSILLVIEVILAIIALIGFGIGYVRIGGVLLSVAVLLMALSVVMH